MTRTDGNSRSAVDEWNPEFGFWKFVASLFVVLLHSYTLFGEKGLFCTRGHLAVELFFVLTGFFFAKSVYKDARPVSSETIGAETWAFLARKTRVFLPLYAIGFAASFAILAGGEKHPFFRWKTLSDGLSDLLFLREFGLSRTPYFPVGWYLACMLAVLFLFYPFFRRWKNAFADWFAPGFAIIVVGLLFQKFGTVAPGFGVRWGFVSGNLCRAAAEICMGVTAFRVAERLRNRRFRTVPRLLLRAAGSASPFAAFALIAAGCPPSAILVVLLLFFVFAALSGAGLSAAGVFPVEACRRLDRLSLSLFLTHSAVRYGLRRLAWNWPWLEGLFKARDSASLALSLSMYLALSFLFAILCQTVCRAKRVR